MCINTFQWYLSNIDKYLLEISDCSLVFADFLNSSICLIVLKESDFCIFLIKLIKTLLNVIL